MLVRPYTDAEIGIVESRIKATTHPKQESFVFDEAKFTSLLTGRGGGKTTGALLRLVRRMVRYPKQNCLFIAATRQSAERLVWRDLKSVLHTLRVQNKPSEQKLTIELRNGSRVMLFGADDKRDIGKLRGITYHAVVVDETASIPAELLRELIDEVIGPRMVGIMSLIGTPGKVLAGRFYDVTRPGSDRHRPFADRDAPQYAGWTSWSSHAWSVADGADHGIEAMKTFLETALINKANEGWADNSPYWMREYLGLWAADNTANVYLYRPHDESGAPFNEWDPERDVSGVAKLPTHLPANQWAYGIGVDVGWSDSTAVNVMAFNYADPTSTLYHLFEAYQGRLYAKTLAEILIGPALDHRHYGGIIGRVGWPLALVGDFSRSGQALLKELSEVYGIPITPADKPYAQKANEIELTNSMLHDGRMKILKGSNLAREMLSLQWQIDQWGKRIETPGQDNHSTDSVVYLRSALASALPLVGGAPELHGPSKPADADDIPRAREESVAGDANSLYDDDDDWI